MLQLMYLRHCGPSVIGQATAEDESDLAAPVAATIEAPSAWSEDAQPRPEMLGAESMDTATAPEPALTPAPTTTVETPQAEPALGVSAVVAGTAPETALTPAPRDFHAPSNPVTPVAATRRPASMESLPTSVATPSPAATSSEMRDLATSREPVRVE